MMNPEVKQKWIEALRSGKYEQIKRKLWDNGKYCCLGVLCEVVGALRDNYGYYKLNESAQIESDTELTGDLADSLGLTTEDQRILTEMNDGENAFKGSPQSFKEIADWIEKNL